MEVSVGILLNGHAHRQQPHQESRVVRITEKVYSQLGPLSVVHILVHPKSNSTAMDIVPGSQLTADMLPIASPTPPPSCIKIESSPEPIHSFTPAITGPTNRESSASIPRKFLINSLATSRTSNPQRPDRFPFFSRLRRRSTPHTPHNPSTHPGLETIPSSSSRGPLSSRLPTIQDPHLPPHNAIFSSSCDVPAFVSDSSSSFVIERPPFTVANLPPLPPLPRITTYSTDLDGSHDLTAPHQSAYQFDPTFVTHHDTLNRQVEKGEREEESTNARADEVIEQENEHETAAGPVRTIPSWRRGEQTLNRLSGHRSSAAWSSVYAMGST